MSILIKGMEMPKSCARCPMLEGNRDDGLCHAASRWLDDEEYWLWYQYPEGDIDTSRPSNCPLVPVSPHGRLKKRVVYRAEENCRKRRASDEVHRKKLSDAVWNG